MAQPASETSALLSAHNRDQYYGNSNDDSRCDDDDDLFAQDRNAYPASSSIIPDRETDSKTHTSNLSRIITPSTSTTPSFEVKLLARSALPIMLTYVLQYSFNLTNVIVAGHLGTSELGAISLATMTASVTGLALYEGMATSLDTLCSQAYGSGHRMMVGIHLQRMVCLLWLVTVPVGAVWICSPWILGALVPEKDVAVLAGSFLRIYIIGAPGFATFEAGKRFVQAQGKFYPPLHVLMVGAPLNVLFNWLFVWKLHLGLSGAAAATSLVNLLQPVLLVLYIRLVIPSTLSCWPGLQLLAMDVRTWGPMLRLSGPGILMVEAEWVAFDVLTFSSAYLGKTSMAAQSVLLNIGMIMYHIAFPASVAVSIRMGNLIGGGALDAARTAVRIYYCLFLAIGLFDVVFLMATKAVFPRIFSDDPSVRDVVEKVMPLCALLQFAGTMVALSNGLLRGLGRQYVGGFANLGIYYFYSIPFSLFLAFGPPHLGLWGLWAGPITGISLVAIIVTVFIKRISWEKCHEDAKRRSE